MIRFINVCKTYQNGTKALSDVTFEIEEGEFVFIVGPSGAGKSTIIKLLTAQERPESGKVLVGKYNVGKIPDKQVPYLRRSVGVVFQDFRLIPNKTVYENVAFVMRAVGAPPRVIKKRVPYVLELVGILHKADRMPDQLSGGEQQRVAIARALVNNPETIIADEPTGNLDPTRSYEIMALLNEINNRGTTVIVVTHEDTIVNDFHKRVIAINGGYIVQDRTGGYYEAEEERL